MVFSFYNLVEVLCLGIEYTVGKMCHSIKGRKQELQKT